NRAPCSVSSYSSTFSTIRRIPCSRRERLRVYRSGGGSFFLDFLPVWLFRKRGFSMRIAIRSSLLLAAGFAILAGNASAQFKNGSQATELALPEVSQLAKVTQRVGITDITIVYHRPAAGTRKIWGDTIAYGKVWRAGANQNTTITFADDVSI